MPTLKISDAYAAWRKNDIKPVYLFAGEEAYLADEAMEYLVKKLGVDAFNHEIFYGADVDVSKFALAMQTLPFLAERRLLVLRDAQELSAVESKEIAEFLKKPADSACVVLVWNERVSRDARRNPLFAAAEKGGSVVEFRQLYDRELPGWIVERVRKESKTIAGDAVQALMRESGANLNDLANEIEKLLIYAGSRAEITAHDVEALSGHTRVASLNTLSEEIEARRVDRALMSVEKLVEEGEVPLRILATIGRVLRRLLVAKSLEVQKKSPHQDIRQELNLNQYFDRAFFTNLAKYTLKDLEYALERLLHADLELKTSARPEQSVLADLVLSLGANRQYQL